MIDHSERTTRVGIVERVTAIKPSGTEPSLSAHPATTEYRRRLQEVNRATEVLVVRLSVVAAIGLTAFHGWDGWPVRAESRRMLSSSVRMRSACRLVCQSSVCRSGMVPP